MTIRLFLVAIFLCEGSAVALAEERPTLKIQWKTLAPTEGAQFRDPFAELSRKQLQDLSYVARIRRLIDAEKLPADGTTAVEAAGMAKRLTNEGVDIPWLMAQRKRVGELRQKHVQALTKSIAKKLDDKHVQLTGFVLPLKGKDGLITEFYLLPTIAACSHASAPPSNQIVYVTSNEGIVLSSRKDAVRVVGKVKAKQTMRLVQSAGGPKEFIAGYTIISGQAEVISQTQQLSSNQTAKIKAQP